MRIIDKNTDFYDYLQNVYRDSSITFDRTDSFVLTKEIICDYMGKLYHPRYNIRRKTIETSVLDKRFFVLLQVCNTFWLFSVTITKAEDYYYEKDKPVNYEAELLATWKNYNRQRNLIRFDFISFRRYLQKESVTTNVLTQAIDTGDYKVEYSADLHTISNGDGTKTEKHIPLLKASGFSNLIDPLDIYMSFEEYFSLEKQSKERTESTGITDKEKIENHGFDTKTSFRGKNTV